jgi:hypothetical protein
VRFRNIRIAYAVIPKIGESSVIPNLILGELFLEIDDIVSITALINTPILDISQYEDERFSSLKSILKI